MSQRTLLMDEATTLFAIVASSHMKAPTSCKRSAQGCYDWLLSKIREAYKDEQGHQ